MLFDFLRKIAGGKPKISITESAKELLNQSNLKRQLTEVNLKGLPFWRILTGLSPSLSG